MKKILLDKNWQFKINSKVDNKTGVKENKWYRAYVPGTVHTDLLKNDLIDDPFYADNELFIEWICNTDWIYQNVFDLPKELIGKENLDLIFEGIDTVAEIFLNSKLLGKCDNMFLDYQFNVSKLLKPTKNLLEIKFLSPLNYAKALEKKYGKLPVALNSERVYIRKAQYSFGWDWGPSFPTMGIWKNIYLAEKDNVEIENFSMDTLSLGSDSALVNIKADIENNTNAELRYSICISSNDVIVSNIKDTLVNNNIDIKFEIKNPKLWWPNGYGLQNLYDLKIEISDIKDNVLTLLEKKICIRTLTLLRKDGNGNNIFMFVVNNQPVYIKGACWIPGDSFLPNFGYDKYQSFLSLAKHANMNMIRVWGGGIYENDEFYNLCDEYGLLVWQDFMFACAAYPEQEYIKDSIIKELKYNINRLKWHGSIAIWCGNNENEWNWFQEQKTPITQMPGYVYYHSIIPDLLKQLDPNRPYVPSTPFGDDDDPSSMTSGNRHQWQIWSMWKDYNEVTNDNALFITEFGFQGPANRLTLEQVIPEEQQSSQSYLFEFHNKQIEGNERIFKFLSAHLPVSTKWKDFIYLAQLNQGLALKTCFEHWITESPNTSGAIVWQLNDCWPVTSWALIDSNITPKAAFYFTMHAFNNNIASIQNKENGIICKLFNFSDTEFNGKLVLHELNLSKNKLKKVHSSNYKINKFWFTEAETKYRLKEDKNNILISSVYNAKNKLLHRNFYIDQPWKYIELEKAKIEISIIGKKDKSFVEITTDNPAFFVHLEAEGVLFKDNDIIVIPGEKYIFEILSEKKVKKSDISVMCLNNYL
ncbi:MAG: glycoside hydrolase family 2 TIM barrel-domain containing protein [Bacteroidota bacterium]|nr:glycoside hydrolase family 2 TIM barrel-domain containing protein [Bacteroidota bacterium]